MAKRTRSPDEYDSPWKDALQVFLNAFLGFFFPDIAADIDWQRGYESLDKELQKIARRAKVGKRLADKLFKVWLADGTERWLLIHIEIQNVYDRDFAERMFQYNIAAYQMYNKEVISLAALCDDRPDWKPTSFRYGHWACKTELIFRIGKLIDFAGDVPSLEASDNPFAAVVLANCKTIETRHDPANRRLWKLRIVKGLYQRNWTREQIVLLFFVIDEMMELSREWEAAFDLEINAFEEEKKVKYVSSIERNARKRAQDEWRGISLEGIEIALDAKFGSTGLELMPKVRKLDDFSELLEFLGILKNASSIDELREYLD